jgi:hypothetical protein
MLKINRNTADGKPKYEYVLCSIPDFQPDKIEQAIDTLFAEGPESRIAVRLSSINDVGVIDDEKIFIYDSYTDALEMINEYEYSKNITVEVFEINLNGYSHILHKCFDGTCYSRYAQPKFHEWDYEVLAWNILLNTNEVSTEYGKYRNRNK